ncbi:MAG TPA: CotH kinase family protein [Chitinophagales bacterium]|nr:CotH kinase family protein [Chitinophagales bacterium]
MNKIIHLLFIRVVLLVLTCLLFNQKLSAQIFINEVVSSNESTISDEDGDFKDWIELYNSSAQEINLTGMYLSDDENNLTKWRFSQGFIPAKGYILIWASGKDKIGLDGQIHTNFSINADGEELILSNEEFSVIDSMGVPSLEKDNSYARIPDGTSNWKVTNNTTPGESNIYIEALTPPTFSKHGGFYKNKFNLYLTTQSEGAIILYTTDGSDPLIENTEGKVYQYKNKYRDLPIFPKGFRVDDSIFTYKYTQPIEIRNRTNDPLDASKVPTTYNYVVDYIPENTEDVFKGTVVKSRIYKEGIGYSDIITQTYFVNSNGRSAYQLPVLSFSTSKEDLFDYEKGLYVAGVDFDDWRKAFPLVVANPTVDANYQRRTRENEYPIQIEYFESNQDTAILNQTVGFRIHGGWTRADAQKSVRLYARSDYGKSKLKYPFFKNSDEKDFKRLIIKNTSTFRVQDAICQNLISHLNFGSQASQFVDVFINGEFWGLHEIKERLDKYYLESKYNIDPDNIDYLNNEMVVKEGDSLHYSAMLDFISNNSLGIPANYNQVANQIDIDNFMDYQIAEIYSNNTDWPHNNVDYWRLRTDSIIENAPYGHDGKWRWLLYDMDLTLNGIATDDSSSNNTLEWATRDHSSTILLRNLIQNKEFSNDFVNRFSDLLNTTFLPSRLEPMIEETRGLFNDVFPEHLSRWKYLNGGLSRLNGVMNRMISFAQTRPEPMREHLQSKFILDGTVNITLNVNDVNTPNYIKINTIDIHHNTVGVSPNPYPWTGVYFDGVPVEITAVAAPGYKFEYWEGMPNGTPAKFIQNFEKDVQLIAHFEKVDSLWRNLTYTSTVGGYLQGDSNQSVAQNENGRPIQAVPSRGYVFEAWSDGRIDNPRIDSNVVTDINVNAIFAVSTSIQNNRNLNLKVYPNPVTNILTVETNKEQEFTYQIIHLNGQIIKSSKAQGKASIDLSSLPASIYLLLIIDKDGSSVIQKIIKN